VLDLNFLGKRGPNSHTGEGLYQPYSDLIDNLYSTYNGSNRKKE